jgi:hypothetical protein
MNTTTLESLQLAARRAKADHSARGTIAVAMGKMTDQFFKAQATALDRLCKWLDAMPADGHPYVRRERAYVKVQQAPKPPPEPKSEPKRHRQQSNGDYRSHRGPRT